MDLRAEPPSIKLCKIPPSPPPPSRGWNCSFIVSLISKLSKEMFIFSNKLIIWCFLGKGDWWEAKGETGSISAAFWSPGLLLPKKKGSSSDSSGSFPKPVAGNQPYFVPLLPLSLLFPPFHQNLL